MNDNGNGGFSAFRDWMVKGVIGGAVIAVMSWSSWVYVQIDKILTREEIIDIVEGRSPWVADRALIRDRARHCEEHDKQIESLHIRIGVLEKLLEKKQ